MSYVFIVRKTRTIARTLAMPTARFIRIVAECAFCGEQLDLALQMIAAEGRGVVVYLRGQEGRGIGLHNKLKAYRLQEQGADTGDANLLLGLPRDARQYSIGSQILADLGAKRLRIITNNPEKRASISAYGLEIVEQIPVVCRPIPVTPPICAPSATAWATS